MKGKAALTLCVVLILAGVWGYHESMAQNAAGTPNADFSVAVVDVAKVLTLCKSNADRELAGKKKKEVMQVEVESIRKELLEIQEELENVLKPGTPEYEEKLIEWFRKRTWEENYGKVQSEIIARESLAWLEDLYGKMLEEIRLLGMQRGITLILDKDEVDERPSKLSEMYTMISRRKVLYNSPSLDLTEVIIERLDITYPKGKNP